MSPEQGLYNLKPADDHDQQARGQLMTRDESNQSHVAILLVDDERDILGALEDGLRGLEVDVVTAGSGREALRAMEERDFAVVVLDVQMPGLDGYKTATLIRERPRSRATPIIFLTGRCKDEPNEQHGYDVGAVDYLYKPFKLPILRSKIMVFLELWRKEETVQRQSDELRHALTVTEQQRDALEQSQRQRELLIQFIVHDLKSPLASMLNNIDFILEMDSLPPDAAEALGDVSLAAATMKRMVLNMLDVARAEGSALTPRLEECDVGAIIAAACTALRRSAEIDAKFIELRVSDQVGTIMADPELVRRIVENLVDNSLRYAPKGTAVHVAAGRATDGTLELSIRDEGPGVPPELHERIFDKYVQLEEGGRSAASRGLGLPFCRFAAEAHGGKVWVEANEPRGSVFRVLLPAPTGPIISQRPLTS